MNRYNLNMMGRIMGIREDWYADSNSQLKTTVFPGFTGKHLSTDNQADNHGGGSIW